MMDNLEIKTTRINNRWHARLFVNGSLYDEMACVARLDIGWICREMLRWYDKCGGVHPWATRARRDFEMAPTSKVFYRGQLQKNKASIDE